ncbi:hypothetical protein Hanom_Chr17g01573931 [Helianthus anomalus]
MSDHWKLDSLDMPDYLVDNVGNIACLFLIFFYNSYAPVDYPLFVEKALFFRAFEQSPGSMEVRQGRSGEQTWYDSI